LYGRHLLAGLRVGLDDGPGRPREMFVLAGDFAVLLGLALAASR
jgi:hypothetical protein